MQPYAIVKNRTYSLPVKFFIATAITTAFVFTYRSYIRPVLVQRRLQKGRGFEEEYFEKMGK